MLNFSQPELKLVFDGKGGQQFMLSIVGPVMLLLSYIVFSLGRSKCEYLVFQVLVVVLRHVVTAVVVVDLVVATAVVVHAIFLVVYILHVRAMLLDPPFSQL